MRQKPRDSSWWRPVTARQHQRYPLCISRHQGCMYSWLQPVLVHMWVSLWPARLHGLVQGDQLLSAGIPDSMQITVPFVLPTVYHSAWWAKFDIHASRAREEVFGDDQQRDYHHDSDWQFAPKASNNKYAWQQCQSHSSIVFEGIWREAHFCSY